MKNARMNCENSARSARDPVQFNPSIVRARFGTSQIQKLSKRGTVMHVFVQIRLDLPPGPKPATAV